MFSVLCFLPEAFTLFGFSVWKRTRAGAPSKDADTAKTLIDLSRIVYLGPGGGSKVFPKFFPACQVRVVKI